MAESKAAKFHSKIAKKYGRQFFSRRLEIAGMVEWSRLMKYLPKKKCRILDAGGGAAEFSIKFAKMGHDAVLTDVSSGMLKEARKKIKKEKLEDRITVLEQDITNMKGIKSNSFDFVVSLGDPVSYCMNHKKAISELSRVAKKGAVVFITVDSYFRILMELLRDGKFREVEKLEKTNISMFRGEAAKFPQYNFKADELCRLYEKNGLKVLDVFSMGNLVYTIDKKNLEKICKNKKLFKKLVALELKYASEPSIVGMAGHLGIIGKKR